MKAATFLADFLDGAFEFRAAQSPNSSSAHVIMPSPNQ
jgi:hypothetical protein